MEAMQVVRQKEPKSIQEAVYSELKRNIMNLRLPPGTIMSTQEMADRLNVSRTPVREAFLRLHDERLVEVYPQRETVVTRIDIKRAEQERFIRESLEIAAMDCFMRSCGASDITPLVDMIHMQRKAAEEKDYEGFIECDNQFHKHIFQSAGLKLGWSAIMAFNGHYNRIRMLTIQNSITLNSAIEQHETLIKMMKAGDTEALRKEIKDHLQKINQEKLALIQSYREYFKLEEDADSRNTSLISHL